MPITKHIALVGLMNLAMSAAAASGSQAREDELQKVIETALRNHKELPNITVTVQSSRNNIDWTGTAGVSEWGGAPMTHPPGFRIASVTKVFLAATTLRLVEKGQIALTDPIGTLIAPETNKQLLDDGYEPERILVRHLMEHSSGLYDYASDRNFVERVVQEEEHVWTRREQIQLAMTNGEPLSAPGERFRYSDTGYIILGEIIERTTGKSMPDAIRELNKFDKLGLHSTYFESLEAKPIQAPPRTAQYLGDEDMNLRNPSFDLYGGGGIVSTTEDLATYFRALFTGQIFETTQSLAMGLATPDVQHPENWAPHAPLLTVRQLGEHQCWGHGGFFGTWALYCPDIDTAIGIAVNTNTSGLNDGLSDALTGVAKTLKDLSFR